MLLKDRKHLSNAVSYNLRDLTQTLTLLATDIEGLVRRVVVL